MTRMTLKPKADQRTLLLCAGGGAFAVVATVALVGVMFTGSALLGSVGAFTAVAALGCLFGAFLPPGLVEGLVASLAEKYRAGEDDVSSWDDDLFDMTTSPIYYFHPGNIWFDSSDSSDPFDD